MNCVSYVSFVVLVNGSDSYFFRPVHVLLKGCPFSPLIFHLVVEGLRRALLEAKKVGSFKGTKVGRSIGISHLLFVDDILFFCDSLTTYALKLREISNLYCLTNRVQVNIGKSIFSFVEISEEDKIHFNQNFPYT
jgi:hypothetical protein